MRGIYSTTGMQIPRKNVTTSSPNSPLTLPACAPDQVNVDFLDGRGWARSTSFSTLGLQNFDILFDPVEMENHKGLDRSAVEAFFESPRPVPFPARPCPSRTPDACPSTDSAWA